MSMGPLSERTYSAGNLGLDLLPSGLLLGSLKERLQLGLLRLTKAVTFHFSISISPLSSPCKAVQ